MVTEEVGRLQSTVARLEGMFAAIERRLSSIETKMVSSDVLDQIVTRLLDRISADTVKPGCKSMFENIDRRVSRVEKDISTLAVKVSLICSGVTFVVTLLFNAAVKYWVK